MMQTPNAQRPTLNVESSEPSSPGLPPSALAITLRIVAILIGALFVYAGVVKIIDPVEFARDIDNYKTLPWQLNVWLALFLPWLEIFCGLALITRVLYRGGVVILNALMFVFIVATIAARARGLDITCGCFGHASKYLSFAGHLALDFLLLGGLVFLWWGQRSRLLVAAG